MNFPDQVNDFLLSFNKAVRDKNWQEVAQIYEQGFTTISDLYYSSSRWPTAESVKAFYEEQGCYHVTVVTLYQELAMRHVFSRVSKTVTIQDRSDSFDNYEALFELMANEICDNNRSVLPISTKWMWGMIDEFVYQYQDTQRYKIKMVNQAGTTALIDSDFAEVYDPTTVKGWLMSFIQRSGIKEFLKGASWNTEYSQRENLGYFALIGLLRVYVISGDFYNALLTGSHIPISARAYYWKVPSANAQFFYHLGVAYIMTGRYIDAVKAMTPLLVFVSKSTHYLSSHSSYEMRTIDRMYCLIKICDMLTTSPLRLDDSILCIIRDNQTDKWAKLQGDDDGTFVGVFFRSMPKFTAAFRMTCMTDDQLGIFQHNLFQTILEQLLEKRRMLDSATSIKTSSKLYNYLPIAKLTQLIYNDMHPDHIEACLALTMQVKNHTTQNVLSECSDIQDVRPRQFQTERVLVSTELADFRLDSVNAISVKAAENNEDRLEEFHKAITQTNDLLAQIRKIPMNSIPAKFAMDTAEPVRMQRVKREGKGRFQKNNQQRA